MILLSPEQVTALTELHDKLIPYNSVDLYYYKLDVKETLKQILNNPAVQSVKGEHGEEL